MANHQVSVQHNGHRNQPEKSNILIYMLYAYPLPLDANHKPSEEGNPNTQQLVVINSNRKGQHDDRDAEQVGHAVQGDHSVHHHPVLQFDPEQHPQICHKLKQKRENQEEHCW